ncbi:MAG: hypothetical protein AAFY88_23115, partial [Acidobacteriota bacterium]
AEGLLVFWHNQGDGVAEGPEHGSIEGQHFNSPGVALWADGLEVRNIIEPPSAERSLESLDAISDGAGGAYVIFEAAKTPAAGDFDVVMQRISGAGNRLWEDHRPVIADDLDTRLQAVAAAPDGGFVVITAEPIGDFGSRLRLFRVDPDGFHLWGTSGLPLGDSGATTLKAFPHASFDAGTLRIAWTEQVSPLSVEMDIYFGRFAADGSRLGSGSAEVVTSASDSQFCQGLVYHQAPPRTVVLWEDLRKGGPEDVDIYASQLAASVIFATGFELGDFSGWDVVVGQ